VSVLRDDGELDVFVDSVQVISGSIERGDRTQAVVTLQITPFPIANQHPLPVMNVHFQARLAEELATNIVRSAHVARDRIGD